MKPRILNLLTDPTCFHPEKAELNLSNQNLTDKDIQEYIVPFLNSHPEIKTLHVRYNNIGVDGAKALAETDPHKRANYATELGIKQFSEVPSLLRLCLFKVKNSPQLNQNQLPNDLKEKLAQPKV